MGCVALSERFFRDGRISAKRIERAAWRRAWSSSRCRRAFRRVAGTPPPAAPARCAAIGDAIRVLDPQAQAITPAGLNRAIDYCVDAGTRVS